MKMFAANVVALLALSAGGCGSGVQGPAKPEDTPVVTKQQIDEAMTKNVPPNAKKMYESYKKGGGGGRRP